MATENIDAVVRAKDQASPVLRKLQSNVTALGSKGRGPLGGLLTGLGGINPVALAAGAGIGIMTGLLADGVAGALAEEKQLGRLDQALQNNVQNWNGSRDAMENAAESAMDLAFSDDVARESLIKLLPATKDETQAVKLMHLAMNIARGRNIDLAAATDIVVKAHMGNTGALRRLGIQIDKTATSTEILDQLQRTYAGNADAYAKTTAGKFESAQLKVDNAMEDVGHELITLTAGFLSHSEAVKGDTDAAEDFLRSGSALIPFFGQLGDAIDDATTTTFEFEKGVRTLPKAVADSIESGIPQVRRAVDGLLHEAFMTDRRADLEAAARQFGNLFTDDLAGSLKNNKDVVETAMDTVMWAIKNPMKLQKELARIEGALTTMEYQFGLAEGNPGVQAVIQQQMDGLKAQWTALTGIAYTKGVSAADAYERGLGTFVSPKFPLGIKGPSRLKGQDYTGYAAGGDVPAGETVMVGERGPELWTAGRGGAHVTANHQMNNQPIHVVSADELARIIDQRQGRMLALSPVSFSR